MAAPGTRSLGLTTAVLPVTNTNGNDHNGTMAGKLNGQIDPITPNGSLIILVSISVATSNDSPFKSLVTLQAASATCNPRKTSP